MSITEIVETILISTAITEAIILIGGGYLLHLREKRRLLKKNFDIPPDILKSGYEDLKIYCRQEFGFKLRKKVMDAIDYVRGYALDNALDVYPIEIIDLIEEFTLTTDDEERFIFASITGNTEDAINVRHTIPVKRMFDNDDGKRELLDFYTRWLMAEQNRRNFIDSSGQSIIEHNENSDTEKMIYQVNSEKVPRRMILIK